MRCFSLLRMQRKWIEEKRGHKLILLYDVKNCFCLLGSYDHKIKVFDARMDKSVLTMDHSQPVESLLLFPSEGLLVSAGGNSSNLNSSSVHCYLPANAALAWARYMHLCVSAGH